MRVSLILGKGSWWGRVVVRVVVRGMVRVWLMDWGGLVLGTLGRVASTDRMSL